MQNEKFAECVLGESTVASEFFSSFRFLFLMLPVPVAYFTLVRVEGSHACVTSS